MKRYRYKAVTQTWFEKISLRIESELKQGSKTVAELERNTGYAKSIIIPAISVLRKRRKVLTVTMPRDETVYELPAE